MKGVYIRIPCRRFTVRVRLSNGGGLGSFEEFTLRAIAAGANNVELLAQYLGVQQTLLLDTCVDLLRAGYLVLHRENALLELTPEVRDTMGDPMRPQECWTARLAPASPPETKEYDLLYDLVSGAVFAPSKGLKRVDRALQTPENTRLSGVASIQKPVLLAATASLLRMLKGKRDAAFREKNRLADRDWLSSRGARVTDISIAGMESGIQKTVGIPDYIVVEVLRRKGHGEAEERPSFAVVGPSVLNGSIRRNIGAALLGLWEEGIARGRGQFFSLLEDRFRSAEAGYAEDEKVLPADPRRAVDDMVEEFNRLPVSPEFSEDKALQVHPLLSEMGRRAASDLDAAESTAASVKLVLGAADHHSALFEALHDAKHQVVMCCPWVGQLQINDKLRDAFVDAVSRGVRVHLLWGVDRKSTFDEEFRQAGRDLERLLAPNAQRTGGLFVAQRSATTHAKFLSCDFDWALVTSCNFLNSGADRSSLEIGVRLTGIESVNPNLSDKVSVSGTVWHAVDNRPFVPTAVVDILQWLQGIVPDVTLRPALMVDPAVDGRRVLATAVEIGTEVEPPGDLNIWRDTFERKIKDLSKRLEKLGAFVTPVFDAQHRESFIEGVRNARRRVVAVSHNLGSGALGQGAFEALLDALRRGVTVTVVHHGLSEWTADFDERRSQLVEAGARFIERDVHAKTVVCDDWAIVTSYNFLSFTGYCDEFHRTRHELGVRITDTQLADEIVKAVFDASF